MPNSHTYKNSRSNNHLNAIMIDSSFYQPDNLNINRISETDYGNKWIKTEHSEEKNMIYDQDCICKSTPRLNQDRDILLRHGFDDYNLQQKTTDTSDQSKNR